MKTRTKIVLKRILWLIFAATVLALVLLPGGTTDWQAFTQTLSGLVLLALYFFAGILAVLALVKYAQTITSAASHGQGELPKHLMRRLKRHQIYLSLIFYFWVVLSVFLRDFGILILFPPLVLLLRRLHYNAKLRAIQPTV